MIVVLKTSQISGWLARLGNFFWFLKKGQIWAIWVDVKLSTIVQYGPNWPKTYKKIYIYIWDRVWPFVTIGDNFGPLSVPNQPKYHMLDPF